MDVIRWHLPGGTWANHELYRLGYPEIRTKTSAEYKSAQNRQCAYNVILRRVRATTADVEK
jgi:hypothetical protein